MKQNPNERYIRRLRAMYRKRIAIWAIVMLIIGLVLGIVADKTLFTRKDKTGDAPVTAVVTATPEAVIATAEPVAEAPAAPAEETATEPEAVVQSAEVEEAPAEEAVVSAVNTATLEPVPAQATQAPVEVPAADTAAAPAAEVEAVTETETVTEAEAAADAVAPAADTAAETVTTEQAAAAAPAAETATEDTQAYTVSMEAPAETPAPAVEATAVPEPAPTEAPAAEPSAEIVPFGQSYDFSTQIKSDGTARITAVDGEAYETIRFTLTMKSYMLPSDFASKWGSVYKLQGTEAGAGFELVLHDYTGSATIVPQNIIKIAFVSESGNTENAGFQLMDAEIAGQTDVTLQPNVAKTLWKRYTFSNAGEEMKYLAVSTYNNGTPQTILFELKSNIAPTPDPKDLYSTLKKTDKSDAVTAMQKRLIELGYLSGDADGDYGSKTETAVKAAQKAYGMDQTGTASPEFQARLFSDDQPEPEPTPEPTERSAD